MKRLLLAATAAGILAAGFAAPAQAAIGGTCDGKIDVACNETPCAPDYPCTITICVVWLSNRCAV